jgi:hypothetical protein
MSITSGQDVEYDDAYVIEERNIKYEDIEDDKLMSDVQDDLELDSLDLSEDYEYDEITADYDRLKVASEMSRKKMDQTEKKTKFNDLKPKVIKREEVVEDFIRNFFTKYNLNKTNEEFNVSREIFLIYIFVFLERI